MSREESADIIKKTTKRFKKYLVKDIKILLKKKKTESENMFVNDIKISWNMENKSKLSMEKKYYEMLKNKNLL